MPCNGWGPRKPWAGAAQFIGNSWPARPGPVHFFKLEIYNLAPNRDQTFIHRIILNFIRGYFFSNFKNQFKLYSLKGIISFIFDNVKIWSIPLKRVFEVIHGLRFILSVVDRSPKRLRSAQRQRDGPKSSTAHNDYGTCHPCVFKFSGLI